jgi:hypothetical protein
MVSVAESPRVCGEAVTAVGVVKPHCKNHPYLLCAACKVEHCKVMEDDARYCAFVNQLLAEATCNVS